MKEFFILWGELVLGLVAGAGLLFGAIAIVVLSVEHLGDILGGIVLVLMFTGFFAWIATSNFLDSRGKS